MNKSLFVSAFLLGALAVLWMASYFIGSDFLALSVTLVIGFVYTIGFIELIQYRRATTSLSLALQGQPTSPEPDLDLDRWLMKLHPSLRNATQARIEGERVGLPVPVVTPYLVGLLVMLGLLGTFVGMVETLKGAVIALEGTTELEAIRAGLAAPINGLSLAFGTSVAGVASSAMLGLAATLSRRDRMQATAQLDASITTTFREFSLVHNRRETYRAMQIQSRALPDVAEKLDGLAAAIEQMTNTLGDKLLENQTSFQTSATLNYSKLAESVDASLKDTLAQSGQLAGESMKPVVLEAMAAIRSETQAVHQQFTDTSRQQLEDLSGSFGQVSAEVAETWRSSVEAHNQSSETLITRMQSSHKAFTEQCEQVSEAMAETWQNGVEAHNQSSETLITHMQSSHKAFTEQCEQVSEAMAGTWQSGVEAHSQSSETLVTRMQASHQAFTEQFDQSTSNFVNTFDTLSSASIEQSRSADEERLQVWTTALNQAQEQTSNHLQESTGTFVSTLNEISEQQETTLKQTLSSLESLSANLGEQWSATSDNMSQLTTTLSSELGTLREEEGQRAEAAVQRLSTLESTVATHLATLGKELEEPMTRLIESASETPKAAAEVIGQLRKEISNNIERDNQLLEERTQIMAQLNDLSTALATTSASQQDAIAELINSTTSVLQDAVAGFGGNVESELGKLSSVADTFAGSATHLSSLGDAFTLAVDLFNTSNTELIESLTHIETSMDKSVARSDEQMSYFVAQAREIVDQSMLSQKEVFEELRQLGKTDDLFEAEAS